MSTILHNWFNQFSFGKEQVHKNLSFIPITSSNGSDFDFLTLSKGKIFPCGFRKTIPSHLFMHSSPIKKFTRVMPRLVIKRKGSLKHIRLLVEKA